MVIANQDPDDSYMHNKSIVHIDPECSLGIVVHLTDIHPLQLFNQNSKIRYMKYISSQQRIRQEKKMEYFFYLPYLAINFYSVNS